MYQESALMDCLVGLAGWRQNQNPDYAVSNLAPGLLTSLTGLYFQDVHPLINIENLNQALKNYDAYTYASYAEHGVYSIGDRVRYSDGKVYEALAAIADAPAVINAPDWVEVNLFSQKIEALTRSSINKVAAAMVTKKKLDGVTKSIFENVQLFTGPGDLMNKELKQGRFVGLEIHVKNFRDIAVAIRRVGTQFSLANPDFDLYLFSSSQAEPISVTTFNLPRANAFTWSDATILLKHLDANIMPGGVYYLGYYEDDLVGNAINRGYNFAGIPCGHCNGDLGLYHQWSNYIAVMPFSVPASYLVDKLPGDPDGALLWDYNVNQYTPTKNYGLNLDLSTGCDVTEFLCREKRLFTEPILYQVAVEVCRELAYNTRNNVIAKETRELAMFALDAKNNSDNLPDKLESAIKALSFDFSDMSDACFPCNNKNGLDWGAF